MFDIDGVLADVRHRLRFLERQPKDWDAFFAGLADDPAYVEGVTLAREAAQDCEVLYVTGRPESCRDDTRVWLARHGLPEGRLVMRRLRDRRPAMRAKPELLARLAGDRVVAVVVEDDAAVCAAYVQAGYPVLHATWADPRPMLEQAQQTEGRT